MAENAPAPTFDPEGYEMEAATIRVLANPKRIMIVDLLGRAPSTVTEIAAQLHLSMQNTSQHLRVMRDRRIVRATRDGREVRYSLTSPVLSECCRLVRQSLLFEARHQASRLGAEGEAKPESNEVHDRIIRRVAVPASATG
ncbi:MAG: metalloregulator ArsR/SmtB family transcription factor [Thermoplasmata archaeon]